MRLPKVSVSGVLFGVAAVCAVTALALWAWPEAGAAVKDPEVAAVGEITILQNHPVIFTVKNTSSRPVRVVGGQFG